MKHDTIRKLAETICSPVKHLIEVGYDEWVDAVEGKLRKELGE
jgi:hypothetical protein